MRILFIGGLYRGYRLAQRLLERGEDVVGAFVYEEDAHESPKYADRLVSLLEAGNVWVQKTRRITKDHLPRVCQQLSPDVVFCLGWRTLIPMEIMACVPQGGVAAHDSLLPRLRGFSPTNWGLALGHDRLGVTLFQLADSVDAGDIYFQESLLPDARESYGSVQEKIAVAAVGLFDRYLDAARAGTLVARKQNEELATFGCARSPADGEIDWRLASEQVDCLIRALSAPAPGAFTYWRGEPLYVTEAHAVERPRAYEGRIPGRIVNRDDASGTVDVLCGEGVLRILKVRAADEAEEPAAAVIRSVRESLGLDHSREIMSLRARVEQLEARLARVATNDAATEPLPRAGLAQRVS